MSVADDIDVVIGHLQTASAVLGSLQAVVGAAADASELRLTPREIWHRLETIDDRIFDALTKLEG